MASQGWMEYNATSYESCNSKTAKKSIMSVKSEMNTTAISNGNTTEKTTLKRWFLLSGKIVNWGNDYETWLTLFCMFHSRPLSLRSFWPVVGIESSGLVQHRKSAIHGLPVKSSKSDWLTMRNEYAAHAQKIGSGHLSGQSSRSQPQTKRIVGSVDENVYVFVRYLCGWPCTNPGKIQKVVTYNN